MAVKTVTLAGKRFVILPESEYRKLSHRPGVQRNGPRRKSSRMSKQDRGDVAEARRREREPSIPLSQLKAELGL